MIFYPWWLLKMYKDRIQWIWVLLSVPQSVIRHAAFILFFFFLFWSFLGFERYEKKAGDLNEPMRYLPCALLQCAIWDYMAAFLSPFIIISYFRYYWNVTMR